MWLCCLWLGGGSRGHRRNGDDDDEKHKPKQRPDDEQRLLPRRRHHQYASVRGLALTDGSIPPDQQTSDATANNSKPAPVDFDKAVARATVVLDEVAKQEAELTVRLEHKEAAQESPTMLRILSTRGSTARNVVWTTRTLELRLTASTDVILEFYSASLHHQQTRSCWRLSSVAPLSIHTDEACIMAATNLCDARFDTADAESFATIHIGATDQRTPIAKPVFVSDVFAAYTKAHATALRRSDAYVPKYPSGRPMDDIEALYRTFTGHATAPQILYESVWQWRIDPVLAARLLEWCAVMVARQARRSLVEFAKWTIRQQLWFTARCIRYISVLISYTRDADNADVFTFPFLAPDILKTQADCEDLAAQHLFMFRCLEAVHETIGDDGQLSIAQRMAGCIVPHYTPVALLVASYLGHDREQLEREYDCAHMSAALIPKQRLLRMTSAVAQPPQTTLPVLMLEAMMNVNPLADATEEHEDQWYETSGAKTAQQMGKSHSVTLLTSITLAEAVESSSLGEIYRMYVPTGPLRGEWAPHRDAVSIGTLADSRPRRGQFTCPMQPTAEQRDEWRAIIDAWQPSTRTPPVLTHPAFATTWQHDQNKYPPLLIDRPTAKRHGLEYFTHQEGDVTYL
jgi:hypothetical protein